MTAPSAQTLSVGNAFRFLLVSAFAVCFVPASHAQSSNVAGRYQRVEVKNQGRTTACASAPLILKHDGRFELRGWEGSYLVDGNWVELSDSSLKTRAKIEPGHRIVLRYRSSHGLVEMVYERRVADLGKTSLS